MVHPEDAALALLVAVLVMGLVDTAAGATCWRP